MCIYLYLCSVYIVRLINCKIGKSRCLYIRDVGLWTAYDKWQKGQHGEKHNLNRKNSDISFIQVIVVFYI